MSHFEIKVRLDTPLLLHGPENRNVQDGWLRPASVRGLIHTWARALIGPLCGADVGEMRNAERRLLGAAGDEASEVGATFRVQHLGGLLHDKDDNYCILPHKGPGAGTCQGFGLEQPATTIMFRPRPNIADQANHVEALWAVVWTAFSFGSLGQRSRRGYGSLTIEAANGEPFDLPVFSTRPSMESLARSLHIGLERAIATVRMFLNAAPSGASNAGTKREYPYFQLAGADQARIGLRYLPQPSQPTVSNIGGLSDLNKKFGVDATATARQPASSGWGSGEDAMADLLDACGNAAAQDPSGYMREIGAPLPGSSKNRLASPLWCRFYKLADGTYIPLVTLSPRVEPNLADKIRDAIGATPDRTIAALAGSA